MSQSLKNSNKEITQTFVSHTCGVDTAVVSVVLKNLYLKKLIIKKNSDDNRKKLIIRQTYLKRFNKYIIKYWYYQ